MKLTYVILKFSALISVLFCLGCTANTVTLDGFSTYADIRPNHRNSYSLEAGAPEKSAELLKMALSYWNQAVGDEVLILARPGQAADVKIIYTRSDTIEAYPAHLEMLGCMHGFKSVADCRIVLQVPDRIESAAEMATVIHLVNQGPLDQELYKRWVYDDNMSEYLKDKLILMSLIHEIGHTLGLGHSEDRACVMAAKPGGQLEFCSAEISAAKRKIAFDQPGH